jgi:hypothetical protein
MIIAGILFLLGILIGLSYRFMAILAASLAMTLVMIPLWLMRAELTFFSLFVWIGYLLALQTGYLVGGFVGTQDDPALPEPDQAAGNQAERAPPQHSDSPPDQYGRQ